MNKAYIYPTAVVGMTAKVGEDTKVWHFVHVREKAEIGRERLEHVWNRNGTPLMTKLTW